MFKQLALLMFVCSCAQAAFAHEDAVNCGKIESDIERLACFDQQFLRQSELEKTLESKGAWRTRVETSPIDDSSNVFLSLKSEDTIRARFGTPGPMVLNIMCRENSTDFSIYFNGHHMSDHQYGDVTYRLDKEKAQRRKFRESTSHKHLGLWGGGKSIPFLKKMLGKETLLIEATPYGENSVLATFRITGLETAIEPLRKACNW